MPQTHRLETDYLVLGAGATGMAFTDALISHSKADVVMVDRRHAAGGHWHDVYPFVRLHQPSSFYGVCSLPLGNDAIDQHGPNQGFYERASGAEVCAYYGRAMNERLLPSGQVRFFPMCDYVGPHRFVSRLTGQSYEVTVRQAFVDGSYLEPSIPANTAPPFEVAPGVRCLPLGELPRQREHAEGYVIIGAGKTASDACLWLLETGVPADAITWVKPREAWLVNRRFVQGGELVGDLYEGVSLQMEAAAQASSVPDLFARLSESAQLLRVDGAVVPSMYKAATTSAHEVAELGRIKNVVRLGRVRRIEPGAIVLDDGRVSTTPGHVHVHCAAAGLNPAPDVAMFAEGRITPQPMRTGLIPFNAALVGFVEATRADVAEKNRLCRPNRLPDTPLDWLRGLLLSTNADYAWSKEPDLAAWLDGARLNPARGLRKRRSDPQVERASKRMSEHVRGAMQNLTRLLALSGA